MSFSTIWIIVGGVVLVVWYQLYSLKDKVFCSYTRPSGQEIVKWVKIEEQKVIFDNLEFTILPERHKIRWYKLLWGILGNIGTWVIAYEFTWDSEFPRDPRTYKVNVINAESRRSMNNKASFVAYNRSVDKQSGHKKGMNEWIPYILIGVVIAIAVWYLYGMIQGQNAHLKAIDDAIRMINK